MWLSQDGRTQCFRFDFESATARSCWHTLYCSMVYELACSQPAQWFTVLNKTFSFSGYCKSVSQSVNLYLNTVKSNRNLKIKNNLTILNKIQNLTTTNLTKTCSGNLAFDRCMKACFVYLSCDLSLRSLSHRSRINNWTIDCRTSDNIKAIVAQSELLKVECRMIEWELITFLFLLYTRQDRNNTVSFLLLLIRKL